MSSTKENRAPYSDFMEPLLTFCLIPAKDLHLLMF